MDPEQQDYIKGLYTRFYKESINGNPSSEIYSEEELLDVFDYAGDIGDDFTQLMVLLKAHRDFPDNEDFTERKGVFTVFNTGGNSLAQEFLDKYTHKSALWDIMRIYNQKPDGDKARLSLDKLIARFDEFDDETIIRLVDLVVDIDQLDWLLQNFALLKSKTVFTETLLNETAQECIDRGMNAAAITLLTELTEIEPFDPHYWRLLSQLCVEDDNLDDALKAVDYALAIDGRDLPTLMLRAQIVFDRNDNHGDAVESMQRLFRKNPDDGSVAFIYAQMLTLVGRKEESRGIFDRFLATNPCDRQMVQGAMLIHDDDYSKRVLSNYLDSAGGLSDNLIEQFSDHLSDVKCLKESVLLQLLWYRRNPSSRLVSRIIYGLYLYNEYREVNNILTDIGGDFPIVDLKRMGATEWTMCMLAAARVGNCNAALSLSSSFVSVDLSLLSPDHRLSVTSAIAIASTLSDLLDSTAGAVASDDLIPIDPFRM